MASNSFGLRIVASDKVFYEGRGKIINNRVTVLVLTAERPEDIDRKRAQEAKEMAEEQLRQKQSQMQYYRTQATLARAMARLRVSDQKHKFNL